MPGDRDDEICQKALELLSDLCSKGEVQNKHCLDFIYYFRDLARPRYSDSGESDDYYLFIYSLDSTLHLMSGACDSLSLRLKLHRWAKPLTTDFHILEIGNVRDSFLLQ